MTPVIEIRLVGAVEMMRDGVPVALPGRRVRALLALLALSAGKTVSTDALARGVWDDEPPEHVRGSVQTSVGRLRRPLGEDLIRTESSGYTVRVGTMPRRCWTSWESAIQAMSAGRRSTG